VDVSPLKAHVVNGQIVLDVPQILEEGAELEVYLAMSDADLDAPLTPEEMDELDAACDEADAERARGELIDADVVINRMRARHGLPARRP
jgi:hypothetical protein